jgi:hypothetical protein
MIIEVDLSGLIPVELQGLSPLAFEPLLQDIAEAARDKWITTAGAELRTSRRDYLESIQAVELKKGVATIRLVGQLANLIENGMPQLDLRTTLLGPNVRISEVGEYGKHLTIRPTGEVGYYRAIPFRHSVPGTGGAVGPEMGSQYKDVVEDAGKLGKDVYGEAKKLKATVSDPYKGTKWGGRLTAADMEKLGVPKLKPHHSAPIFQGMVRERKTYEKARQTQYMTFRTISTLVSTGWIRPATEGRHYGKKVAEYVRQMAPAAMEAYVKGMGK